MRFDKYLETVYNEIVMTRQTRDEKRMRKRALRRAHRNTNWKMTKPKKGFKRVKIGGNRYVFERLTSLQKTALSRVGSALGRAKQFR